MNTLIILAVFVLAVIASELVTTATSVTPPEAFEKNSLVLVPVPREKRSIGDSHKTGRKYHRLAHSLHVQSDIRYRYATTLVTSEVRNPEPEAREVFLSVILPDTAFISRFAIEVDSQLFVAFVKEKTEAWKDYQQAVAEGKTAGHVGISARHSNHFRVSVNTEAKTDVVFFLLYEELLQRRAGVYEHVVNLTPRQKLKSFDIEVNIHEKQDITYLHVPELRRHEVAIREKAETSVKDVRVQRTGGKARIRYKPDLSELQRRLRSKHALQFVVEYDVRRPDKGGEVQVADGYFVHFVAPENLPAMPKHVVFVLDTSGSMIGKKMDQTKSAMQTILGEMRVNVDFITIINFADNITTWSVDGRMVVRATPDNLKAATDYVVGLSPKGGTNLNDALIKALTVATHVEQRAEFLEGVQPMIFFLTDGHATSGETDNQKILGNVRAANRNSFAPVFSLAFGRQADFQLLKVLSLQNNAFARKIYVAADASLQLEGFYKEVSSPILRDVKFVYQDHDILAHSLTSTNFHTYYQGSEMVVAGKLPGDEIRERANDLIEYEILATQAHGQSYVVHGEYNGSAAHLYPQTITETIFDVVPQVRAAGVNHLERLWAYLTIQDLLKRVAKGDMTSCDSDEDHHADDYGLDRQKRASSGNTHVDDEDFYPQDDADDGSGSYSYDHDHDHDDEEEVEGVEDVMDAVGDADIIICDNLERALYLSLKYEFVTPLTSLVVVKPDRAREEGQFSDVDQPPGIMVLSGQVQVRVSPALLITLVLCFYTF